MSVFFICLALDSAIDDYLNYPGLIKKTLMIYNQSGASQGFPHILT